MASRLVVVMASANPHKAREIAEILGDAVDLRPRPRHVADVVEDGASLVDNARLKAVALVKATGFAAVADDTGLEVDALGGAPGVHSARYAGETATSADNVAKLLRELREVAPSHRAARFRTVALLRFADGRELVAHGLVEGRITMSARGDGGFGYDPVFEPTEGGGVTFGEMPSDAKHAISHRGRAFRALARMISDE